MRRFALTAALSAAFLLAAGTLPATHAGWSIVPTRVFPAARAGHAAAYDPVSAKIVIFGGDNKNGYLADTWTFNGTAWVKLSPKTAPSKRTVAGMAYDEITKQLVLFGGFDGVSHLGDTWLFDGAKGTWTKASPQSSPLPGSSPIAFTDPLTGHAIVYGGFGPPLYHDETWQWTGTDWVLLAPADHPAARAAAAAGYDSTRRDVVLFSGLAGINIYDTWTWDGTDWTLQSPAIQPSQRFNSAAASLPAANQVVVFGGNAGEYVGDTWVWDGSNWTQIATSQAPSPRELHSMVYFPPTGQIVLFGGANGRRSFPDTWTYTP